MMSEPEPRYQVTKVVNGDVENTHECHTWSEVEELKDAISLVKGKAVVENINRNND